MFRTVPDRFIPDNTFQIIISKSVSLAPRQSMLLRLFPLVILYSCDHTTGVGIIHFLSFTLYVIIVPILLKTILLVL
jgi:hypothetical protein